MLKQMLLPTSSALPRLERWTPSDAMLTWHATGNTLKVTAFGDELTPNARGIGSKVARGMGALGGTALRERVASALGVTKPRVPPSAGDPSLLAGSRVECEDDALLIDPLPRIGPLDGKLFVFAFPNLFRFY